jgi:hypothetical protein
MEIVSVTAPLDLTPPDLRPNVITFNTSDLNLAWLVGLENETGLSRSLLIHRVLSRARLNIGIATIEGERRQGERRTA